MAENKTKPTDQSPEAFLETIDHERRRAEAHELLAFFRKTTGWRAKMWGPSMIGFGRYHYVYASGREGDALATGFSPRKAAHSIYIMPGYVDLQPILDRLGKHKTGKACVYVAKLADIDIDVLRELVLAGLSELRARYEVYPD